MKKQKILSLLIAGLCACTCFTVGAWALDIETANAAWTNEGGVDHYTDMTSNGEDLEYYDTLYNEDWTLYNGSNESLGAMPKEWTIVNDQYMRFTPSVSNTTGSFVWKYTYTCTDASTGFYIYPLSGGAWNGAQFLDYHSCGFEAGKTYDVEFGSIKVKNNTNYYVYIKVDGVFKMGTYRDESQRKGNDLYFYITGGAGMATSQKPEVTYEYEDYVVVQNDDFGGAPTLSWGGDATNGLTLSNELPTASFVYKFHYTPGSGDTALALRSSYWGSYHFLFRGKTLMYNLNAGYVTVGEVFADGAQLVEVGAIEIKNSDLTWFFLKVNGEEKMSATAANVPDVKSISAWGDEMAVFAQYSYDVSFNGEVKEIIAGQAIGTLPEAPANENELLGWFDQDGNKVTAETVVTKDLTVTAVFAEPHNVTFTVDGEVYATYENVAYNTAIGVLPVAPKKAGYDFVKWTYGGEEITAETIVSAHMTVVAEYVERGYYIDEELENYVVVQNDDLGLAGAYTVSSGDATSDVAFESDTETASYVYKFQYIAQEGDAIVYMRSMYWGGNSNLNCFLRGTQILYQVGGVDNVVNDVFVIGETHTVELGAIDIKDSDNTWIFVKVNGNLVFSKTVSKADQVKGISFYGSSTSVFAQYSWTVDFDGEKREVVNGAAIGELPAAPESEYEFMGWADQYGNILTAETAVTENLTATPVFNEPHTVTFVVNGQTLSTVENIGYQETATLPECNVPGYDFVKWVYGDNEEFTAETQVVSNLTVTAVLTARDFTEEELANYVTVTNKNIGAAASIKNTNSSFANYEIVTENETSSVVYQFVYAKGEMPLYMVVRDVINGWGTNADGSAASGYIFILNGATLETPVGNVADAFTGENSLYLVEIGVIDVKGSNEVWIYVNVNGNKIVNERMEKRANVGNYIDMFGDDASTSTINEAEDYHFLEGVVEKHTVVEVEGLAATCTEAGYTAYSYCEICESDIVVKELLDALGHEEETVAGYVATCTETGLTDGCVCTVCEEVLVEQTEIAALGHDLQEVEAVASDCETVGATAGERCIREGCGVIVSGCEEVPATGHTAVVDEAVASTCIERGKTEGSHCGTCGKILQEQESLPLAEHNYVDGICSVCGDEDISSVVPEDSSKDSSTDESDGSSASMGCFGSVGGAISGIVTAIGAAFLCVKKKKEE